MSVTSGPEKDNLTVTVNNNTLIGMCRPHYRSFSVLCDLSSKVRVHFIANNFNNYALV